MKKTIIFILSAAVMLGALCSCEDLHKRTHPDEGVPFVPGTTATGSGAPEGSHTSRMTAEELHEVGNGEMFIYYVGNCGEVCIDDDYWVRDIYTVFYDGTIEYAQNYNISDTYYSTSQVSDEDLVFIYESAADFMDSDANGTDAYGGCDAPMYVFTLYGGDGESHMLFRGDYPSGCFRDICDTMSGYFLDEPAAAESSDPSSLSASGLDLTGDWEFLLDVADPADHEEGEDYLTHTQYRVRPDGTVEITKIYRISGITYDETFPLYPSDCDLVCGLLENGRDAFEPGDVSVEADGMRYQFTFFDSEGEGTVLYTGDNSFGLLPQEVLYNLSGYYRLS